MTNTELKGQIKKSGFALWQVAEVVGVCELTIQRWLRSDRDTKNQSKIIAAFEQLKGAAANAH